MARKSYAPYYCVFSSAETALSCYKRKSDATLKARWLHAQTGKAYSVEARMGAPVAPFPPMPSHVVASIKRWLKERKVPRQRALLGGR